MIAHSVYSVWIKMTFAIEIEFVPLVHFWAKVEKAKYLWVILVDWPKLQFLLQYLQNPSFLIMRCSWKRFSESTSYLFFQRPMADCIKHYLGPFYSAPGAWSPTWKAWPSRVRNANLDQLHKLCLTRSRQLPSSSGFLPVRREAQKGRREDIFLCVINMALFDL